MYIVSDFIDMGLLEGQVWPSEVYRTVASNIAICNPNVRDRDTLTQIVQSVLKVPERDIRFITLDQLIQKYNLPSKVR